ncbi:putative RGS domain-containing protein [Plasmopara halstedii]
MFGKICRLYVRVVNSFNCHSGISFNREIVIFGAMGAAVSVDDPNASAIWSETKEEYDRRVAAGDSKELIFSSLREIIANHMSEVPSLSSNSSISPRENEDNTTIEQQKRLDSFDQTATLTPSNTIDGIIESAELLDQTPLDNDADTDNLPHDEHEMHNLVNENDIPHAYAERGYKRVVGPSRGVQDLVQNLAPVFTTDVLTDPATLKMILRYAEAHKIQSGADMLRFWVEIDELQHLPSHSYTHRRLHKIYDKFLSPEAQSPVCVTAQMLQDIEKALEGDNISAGIYAGAQQICFIALEKSVYPRFRESKLFQKMQDFCAPIVPNTAVSANNGSNSGPLAVASSGTAINSVHVEETEVYSLLGILAHPAKLRFLKTFCMEALALENLLFYLEVEDCKRLPNLSFVVNKTRKIYDRYCSPTSKTYIASLNGNGAMKELQDVVDSKGALVPKLFHEIQISVFERISDEIWPGFCRSQEYLDHSKEVKPDTKQIMRRTNRFEENEAVQKKLDALAEFQLIDIAMHYPVEKLIPFSFPDSRQAANQGKLVTKFEEEQRLSPEQILTLLLGDPLAKKYLKLFMTQRGSEALLAFCEEVEDFKLLPGIEFLQHSAKKIYRKYIIPSARLQVDMSTTMRDEIYTRLANPSVDMFKKIANRVRHGMLQDSLPRFVKSSYYKELRRDSKFTAADTHLAVVDQAAKAGKLELCHLDVFLSYPGCMQAFRKFLDFQHCSENLMLWEEIEHYRRLPSYQIVLRSARKIYDKYLNPSNPRTQIPLAVTLCQRVEAQLDVACRTTFDEVENECYDHMRSVVVPDFLDSRIFMALVGAWAIVHEDYPGEMLRGELEMAFLRHRFHLVQEARGMSRETTLDKGA